ncbi:hypothetical protein HDU84_004677 [Entophlyctis sp. JEL0112]|nr:hypothetical protein HDU84_004677 [Entophlyctis sp. JEL0112]
MTVIPFITMFSPKLAAVDLSSSYLDDGAFRYLVKNLPCLVDLGISKCTRLTDEGMIGGCGGICERVLRLRMSALYSVSKEGFRLALQILALKAEHLVLLDISSNSANIDYSLMLEFATTRNARRITFKNEVKPLECDKVLMLNVTGEGWEFTKEEISVINGTDRSLKIIHNSKLRSHSKEGVMEYLATLQNAY